MKNSRKTASVNFFKEKEYTVLEVKGNYFGGYFGSREDPPEESEFKIDSVDVVKGNLMFLLDNFKTTEEIILAIETKCIENLQSE